MLATIPGVTFNFSQVIQDNVQEAMSGVKGENSIKLFGTELKIMEEKAVEIERVMKQVPGVKDLGIFRLATASPIWSSASIGGLRTVRSAGLRR